MRLALQLAPADHDVPDLRHDGARDSAARHSYPNATRVALNTTKQRGYDYRSTPNLQDV
jgi:hypothetical protein